MFKGSDVVCWHNTTTIPGSLTQKQEQLKVHGDVEGHLCLLQNSGIKSTTSGSSQWPLLSPLSLGCLHSEAFYLFASKKLFISCCSWLPDRQTAFALWPCEFLTYIAFIKASTRNDWQRTTVHDLWHLARCERGLDVRWGKTKISSVLMSSGGCSRSGLYLSVEPSFLIRFWWFIRGALLNPVQFQLKQKSVAGVLGWFSLLFVMLEGLCCLQPLPGLPELHTHLDH